MIELDAPTAFSVLVDALAIRGQALDPLSILPLKFAAVEELGNRILKVHLLVVY